jgi:hypothetical protein
MSALSATVVQKALKAEVTTIYANISVNPAGTTATLVTGNGASKGVASAAYVATGKYVITLQPGIAVNQYLGAPSVILKNDDLVDDTYVLRVLSSTVGTGATITLLACDPSAPGTPAPIVSSGSSNILVTIPFTTSNTF